MASEGDGSDSRYSQGMPSNELEDDTVLNTVDATLTTVDQSAALAGIQRFPTTNEEIAQRLRASLQQLISDAARQGIDLSVTEGLMSPHNLSTPNQQTARLRSAVVIPTPDAPPKARRDPTGRPEMLSERVARRSREHREGNDSDKGYDQDRIAGDRDHPRRRSHRRDRSSSSEESEQNHHRKRQRGTVWLHGLNRDRRELNPEERGQKLTISQNFNALGEPEGDRNILIQSLTREVQNNRRQMDALVRRYGRNELSDDESGSPFTNGVLRMPFLERFKMPHIELFKKDTDPKEHVRRYRSAMTQYVHNDALLCLNFPQTLGDLGSRWFSRLPAASISSFGELSKAFSRQFLGNVHMKKSVAHLSQLKQGKDVSLKRYLGRFGQEVSEIGSANDEAIIAAFINNLQNGQLSFDLRRARLTNYANMMDMAGGYALAEEEEIATGGYFVHGGRPEGSKTKDQTKAPDTKGDKQKNKKRDGRDGRRAYDPKTDQPRQKFQVNICSGDTTKYCRFHKENGHKTSKCFQLRDHIETLIREGHLKDIVLKKVDRADGQKDSRQDGRARKLSPKKAEDEGAINIIFGGLAIGKSNRERTQEIREAMEARRDLDVNSIEPDPKRIKEGWDPIIFTEADSHGVDVRPNDALVISARIGHREVHRILIDNGSSADILSVEVYDQLRLDRKDLQPFPTPLRGFGGVEVRSLGTVKLPVKIGKAPCQKTVLLDFVVVDTENWPYNALLGRPFLNKAKAVTATYALMMKFPTEYGVGVGVVKGSQEMARRANLSVYKDREVHQVYTVTAQQKVGEPEEQAEVPKEFELDPREEPEDKKDEPTQEVALDPEDPSRTMKVGASLSVHVKTQLVTLLRDYKDVFAWSHEDMLGVDPRVISHHLSINPEFRPVVQKRRLFNPERSIAIKKEVEKLLSAGSIREVKYPEWVANVVLVKKKNKQWRMCVDFTDLNKACPKDSFPLPRIDQLVDATAGHELLSFMDAYSGYNQIRMNKADEEKTSFTTNQGLYCYKVIPFGLKNAGATYQRLVNRIFARQIGKNMEVYVDDMLTKSTTAEKHTEDLKETFDVLRKYQMKLNPSKCVFGVPSGKFLGFQVHQRGIEVNPEKIKALEGMASPKTLKDVQRLTGCLASLNRFIAKSTDKCAPFFKAIKKGKGLEWSTKCEEAFQKLKEYLGRAPILSKPVVGETLYIYLSVTEVVTSSVLIRLEEGIQKPVYYTSKALLPAETSEYDIRYTPKAAIKGQAVSDFIAEFTEPDAEVRRVMEDEQTTKFQWKLHVDGSSNTHGSGAGIVITTPEGDTVECAMRFDFKATNNQAEYEALLAGLRVCIALGADELEIYSDSQVVVNQVLDEY
ncbi:hypothetical protein LWI29_027475 [Acer saccharum]|uniref:RNase H type-1 domain-containing protein n=1 Tax=Acer saccharum TaxID=4024 RepID=A0AA39TI48_ACESA|nr:hypothetical protein LWI29_027475 [Acer saccharum]